MPTSPGPDSRNPIGRRSWVNDDARPSWSAATAMTVSTGNRPNRSRSSHRRAGCSETGPSGSEGGRAEKDQHQAGTSPFGRPYPDTGRRLGVPPALHQRVATPEGPPRLDPRVQPSPTPHRHRRPPAHQPVDQPVRAVQLDPERGPDHQIPGFAHLGAEQLPGVHALGPRAARARGWGVAVVGVWSARSNQSSKTPENRGTSD